jgi:hypothetical protein
MNQRTLSRFAITLLTLELIANFAFSNLSPAQFFGPQSSSSSSRSSSWSSKSGFGPNGYFNDNTSSESGTDSNTTFGPFGGTNNVESFNNTQNNSSGFDAFTGQNYNNQGGSSDTFSSQDTFNNSFPWGN